MAYRNKTYVAFASEDIRSYWMMTAWHENANIPFDFLDAHDINTAFDTSQADTIRRRLRERLANTKQAVVLISDTTKSKAARLTSFIYYEVEVIERLNLPIVFVNLNGSRRAQTDKLPSTLASQYSVSVSFQPKIVQYALDEYVEDFKNNLTAQTRKRGPHYYEAGIYEKLGL